MVPGPVGPRVPGCLTSKSEERETWTAESLRPPVSIPRSFGFGGFGTSVLAFWDIGTWRLDETSAVHVSRSTPLTDSGDGRVTWREPGRAVVPDFGLVTDLVKRCDRPRSRFQSNLRV